MAALLAGRYWNFTPLHPWNYLVFTDEQAGALLAFINWDGQHYLRLALSGYPLPPNPSSAFFPLLPWLMAGGLALGLGPIAAGLAVVTLASAAAFYFLARLATPSSLWLFASFPTAFYLSVVYSEALFLAALLGLIWALRDPRRAGLALACGALLPLARGQGMWIALPLAVAWFFGAPERRALKAATAGYALGVLVYLGFFWWRYSDPFAGFAVQKLFVFNNALPNLLEPQRFADFLVRPPGRFLDTTNSGLDKLVIWISLGALAYGVRRSPDAFLAAAWICLAVFPAMMGEGGSYARHALAAWACFALVSGPTLHPALKWTLVGAGFALQLYLAFQFGGNRWVG